MNISMNLKKIYIYSNGNSVILPNIFSNESIRFNDYEIRFNYGERDFKIELISGKLNVEELKSVMYCFYTYLKIILGYYPPIINASFVEIEEIPKKYKTEERYIRNNDQFGIELSNEEFEKSFNLFLKFYEKVKLQLAMLDVATMQCGCYCENSMVNVLQSFDGIFDNLSLTRGVRNIITNGEIIKIRKSIKYMDLATLLKDNKKYSKDIIELKSKLLERNIKESTIRINKINYSEKLKYIFDNTAIDIFKMERELEDGSRYCYKNIIKLLKNTRNRLAHASNSVNQYLCGKECVIYMYKVLFVYRLIIIREIGLEKK